MKSTNQEYKFNDSLERIDEILDASNDQFEEKDAMPSRDELTFTNGFYVNCTALFVDICDSSDLTDYHERPVLAKIYRSFISEMVALLNSLKSCKEVSINGDCVWGVYDTPMKSDIDDVFTLAVRAGSLVDVLNYKLEKKKYKTYKVGIGIDDGRALMIKAGYNGSGINDVVWMGDVVNQACHLCSDANQGLFDNRIFLSNVIYNNLNNYNKSFCTKDNQRDIYQSNAVNVSMNNWIMEQNK